MKKIWWLLLLFIIATGVREALDHFGPMAQAFRAYREQAEADVRATKNDARFQGIEGNIISVSHRLESAERNEDGGVRLVVVEAVQFQRFTESGPFGNRRVAQTRQHVVMTRREDRWVLSDFREDSTEVTELSDLASDGM
jgi:hypothetical protein